MKTVRLIREQNGLNTSEDPLNVPQGSLLRARNVWAIRKGLLESRRGFESIIENVGNLLGGDFGVLFRHNSQLFYHTSGVLYTVDPGSVVQVDTFNVPSDRLRTFEHRGVTYLLSSSGPLYLETTTTPQAVGVPEALDVPLSCPPESFIDEGPIPIDSQVGYRVVWKRSRGNRILRGAPSLPSYCVNAYKSATWTQTGASEITIELDGVQEFFGSVIVGQVVHLQNWSNTTDPGTNPNEASPFTVVTEMGGSQITITATGPAVSDVGTVDFCIRQEADVTIFLPADWRDGDQAEIYRTESSTGAGNRPTDEYYLAGEIAPSIGATSVIFSDERDLGLGVPLYTNPSQGSGGQSNHDVPVSTFMAFYRGHTFYAAPSWQEELTFTLTDNPTVGETVTLAGETYTAGSENSGTTFKVATESTEAASIRVTAQNLIQQINAHSTQIRASYTSGEDGVPGQITVRERQLEGGGFSFSSTLDATTQPGFTQRPGGDHEILISKYDEPESVNRLLGRVPVGSEGKKVLGLAAVRDALIIFKEDGVFGLYGETDRNTGAAFEVREIDRTVKCLSADSIQVVDNIAFALTNQGFVGVNEYQVQIISHRMDRQVREWIERYDLTKVHSVAYEAEHFYVVWINDSGWVYYTPTGSWTEGYARPFVGAFVDQTARRLYTVTDEGTVLRERKAMNDTDYQDEDFVNPQGAQVPQGIEVEVIWADVAGSDASTLKRFSRASIEFLSDRASRHQVGFSTDVEPSLDYESEGYETTYFASDLGSAEPVIALVPREKQVGRRLRVGYRHSTPGERVELSQVAVQLNEFKGIRSGSRGVPKRSFS